MKMAMFLNTCNSLFKSTVHYFPAMCVNSITARRLSTNVTSDLMIEDTEEDTYDIKKKERAIEKKRNVSRLNSEHRNLLNDRVPYPEPKADFHLTVKYRRKMFGKYGSNSGVNPGIMWPTKEDIKERKEYESVAYPFTIQEMVRAELSKKEAQEAKIWERQNKIAENFKKLDKWVDDMEKRRAKKIKTAAEAKAKNDRLVEEVRRHFGYSVDHREEKFQQMLEQKQREEKQLKKLEKKKKHDEMMMQELMSQAQKSEQK